MNLALSEHLPLIASAPDGIQKLRGLILELAVRGKLLPQDPNDSPASELLQRISKNKFIPPVKDDEKPFNLPPGWTWARIANIANSQAGFAFKSSGFNQAAIGLPLIRIRDVGVSNPSTYFDGEFREEFIVSAGDLLISMDGEFRVAPWIGPSALLNQRVSRFSFITRN